MLAIKLLGALAIGISDRLVEAAEHIMGHTGEAAAAIVQIGLTPGLNIRKLSKILALSHSATVRLTMRLASSGYLLRHAGNDRREVGLTLTGSGKAAMRLLQKEHGQILATAINDLAPSDLNHFSHCLRLILKRLPRNSVESIRIYRYCSKSADT